MDKPLVAVIMGSKSDWETMRHADEMLTRFGVPHESPSSPRIARLNIWRISPHRRSPAESK